MNLQPRLQTNHISIEPLSLDQFDVLYECARDPLIWEQHPEPTRHQRDVFEKFFFDAIDSKGALLISYKDSGEAIGSSRYYKYDLNQRSIYVGYTFIVRKYWGSFVNTELKAVMLKHAFKYVDEVRFEVGAENLRSQKAMLKVGAVKLNEINPEKPNHFIFSIQKKPNCG